MKKITALIFFFGLLTMLEAKNSQFVQYSEAVDVFEITDNLAKWNRGNENAYRDFWVKKFGLEGTDYTLIKRYNEIRSKYQAKLSEDYTKETLFSNPSVPLDFFSNAFYTSRSVGEALRKLRKKLSSDEVKFLADFYNHFKKNISVMVKESTYFIGRAKEFDNIMKKKKAKSLSKKIAKFFNRKGKRGEVKVFYVWWPKEADPKISVVGQNVILRYHPIEHVNKLSPGDVMEGVVLAYTASMTPNAKINISKQFESICVLSGPIKKTDILERPLATAIGRILLAAESQKKKFNLYKNWNIHPWGNVYSKLLYPLVEKAVKRSKSNISSGDFATKAAQSCHELAVLKDFFGTFNTSNN